MEKTPEENKIKFKFSVEGELDRIDIKDITDSLIALKDFFIGLKPEPKVNPMWKELAKGMEKSDKFVTPIPPYELDSEELAHFEKRKRQVDSGELKPRDWREYESESLQKDADDYIAARQEENKQDDLNKLPVPHSKQGASLLRDAVVSVLNEHFELQDLFTNRELAIQVQNLTDGLGSYNYIQGLMVKLEADKIVYNLGHDESKPGKPNIYKVNTKVKIKDNLIVRESH